MEIIGDFLFWFDVEIYPEGIQIDLDAEHISIEKGIAVVKPESTRYDAIEALAKCYKCSRDET
jgi:hypothetical protein